MELALELNSIIIMCNNFYNHMESVTIFTHLLEKNILKRINDKIFNPTKKISFILTCNLAINSSHKKLSH